MASLREEDRLRALAARASALVKPLNMDSLPPVRRDLNTLYDESMRAVAPADADTVDATMAPVELASRAQRLLLTTSRMDIEEHAQHLQSMQLRSQPTPTDVPPSTDVKGYLRTLTRAAVGVAVAEAQASQAFHIESFTSSVQTAEWEMAKTTLLSSLGFVPAQTGALDAAAASLGVGGADDSASLTLAAAGLGGALGASAAAGAAGAASLALAPQDVSIEFGQGAGDALAAEGGPLAPYTAVLASRVREAAVVTSRAAAQAGQAEAPVHPIVRGLATEVEQFVGNEPDSGSCASFPSADPAHVSGATRLWLFLLKLTLEEPLQGGLQGRWGAFKGAWNSAAGAAAAPGARALRVAGLDDAAVVGRPTPGAATHWAVRGAAFLESFFAFALDTVLAENAAAVERGAAAVRLSGLPDAASSGAWSGGPEPLGKVRAYINYLVYSHGRTVGGMPSGAPPAWALPATAGGTCTASYGGYPLWPQVYLLLRSGARAEALAAVRGATGTDPARGPVATLLELQASLMQATDAASSMGQLLAASSPDTWPVPPPSAQALDDAAAAGTTLLALLQDGRHRGVSGVDPWFLEVARTLIGPCDDAGAGASVPDTPQEAGAACVPARHASPVHGWLWRRLWWATLCDYLPCRLVGDLPLYTLAALGAELVAPANRAAIDSDGRTPYRFAEAAMLAGLPELAVAHLMVRGHVDRPAAHLQDAVHLAVALNFYGLLRVGRAGPSDDAGEGAGGVDFTMSDARYSSGVGIDYGDDATLPVVLLNDEVVPLSLWSPPEARAAPGQPGGMALAGVAGEGAALPASTRSLLASIMPGAAASGGVASASENVYGPLLSARQVGSPAAAATWQAPLYLDLPRLLTEYASRSLGPNPCVAADYLSLIPGRAARVSALSDLLVGSRAYATLAGPLTVPNSPAVGGARIEPRVAAGFLATHGASEPVVPLEEVHDVLAAAAATARDANRFLEALALSLRLPLAPHPHGLLDVLRLLLSRLGAPEVALHTGPRDSAPGPVRCYLVRVAESVLSTPALSAAAATSVEATRLSDGLRSLLAVVSFADTAATDPASALATLDRAALLPTEATPAAAAALDASLPRELLPLYPRLVLAAGDAMLRLHRASSSTRPDQAAFAEARLRALVSALPARVAEYRTATSSTRRSLQQLESLMLSIGVARRAGSLA